MDKQNFMTYIKEEFPGCIDKHWNWDLLERIIDYGIENKNNSVEELASFLADMIPEVTLEEIERFLGCEKQGGTNMKRMGFYTGKIYDDSVNPEGIKECCQFLNFKEPILEDEELIISRRKLLRERCIGCNSCEESQKNIR